MIPLTRPWLEDDETEAMSEVLRTGMLVQGPAVADFEAEVAARAGRTHGVAVSSGTAALSIAFEALGIGAGDEVLCPALTWPSPAHAAQRRGARVRLVDVCPAEWNARPEDFAAALTPKTRAIVSIDQFGNPVRAPALAEFAAAHGLTIVEDAACALGARFADGRPAGSLGAASTFSFHPRKILTTGEGGVLATDAHELAERAQQLRNHGQARPGVFTGAGENFRMTELQGALGQAQMKRLDTIVARRRALRATMAAAIEEALGERVALQREPAGARSNWQTFGLVLADGIDREHVLDELHARGVGAGLLSYAVDRLGTIEGAQGALPVAHRIADQGLALPLFPQLSDDEAERVVAALIEVVGAR